MISIRKKFLCQWFIAFVTGVCGTSWAQWDMDSPSWVGLDTRAATSGGYFSHPDEDIRVFTLKVHQPSNSLLGQKKQGSQNGIVAVGETPSIRCGHFLQSDTGEIARKDDCTAIYREGAVVTLQAFFDTTTVDGYQFNGWGGACTGVGTCVFVMTANQSVVATFSKTEKTGFSLKIDKTGKGAVSTTVGAVHCHSRSSSCSIPFHKNSQVTLMAIPDDGYHFTGWGGACAGIQPCIVNIKGDQAVMASFAKDITDTAVLHVKKVGQGIVISESVGIHCGVSCTTIWPVGMSVVLEPVPLDGYIFSGWRGNCSGIGTCAVAMHGDRYVEAIFSKQKNSTGNCTSRDFSHTEERISGAYIAYYGRLPDAAGLRWWMTELDGDDIRERIDDFGYSPEFLRRFGGLDYRLLVGSLYHQMFGRDALSTDLVWWLGELEAQRDTLGSVAMTIHDGARDGNAPDATVLDNRRKVARHYITASDGKTGLNDETLALVLATVGADSASLDAACYGLTNLLH